MFLSKFKIIKILSLILLALSLSSCEQGCVETYDFGSLYTTVSSYPTSDGIQGTGYNDTTGGQTAIWHETGLKVNGEQLIILIQGSWTSWKYASTKSKLNALQICTMCAKLVQSDGEVIDNCMCAADETPTSELNSDGTAGTNDCSGDSETDYANDTSDDAGIDAGTGYARNQDDPDLCTCTNYYGTIEDNQESIYYIILDYQEKNGTYKYPDDQDHCRFTSGIGLYAGLFGTDGNTLPTRVYHLYSTDNRCLYGTENDAGECLDDNGYDVMSYLYESPNYTIWMKDDNEGNDGNNTDTSSDASSSTSDEYHEAGEKIKIIIYDQYYSDNYGYYVLSFLGGTMGTESTSLFEYLVSLIEDTILGEEDSAGDREGGVLQYLYEAIVQDSGFAIIVQLCLSLFVVFYGMAYLMGLKEVNKKELMIRVFKIAIVIAFASETSWTFYNNIVVGFFKDGMDGIITMMSDLTDTTFGDSLAELTAAINDTTVSSEASRFSYIDQMINNYTSAAVTKKIWGLFFGVWFGFLLIPAIYLLIIYFIWTATRAVLVYVTSMIKLVFAIAIGPLFIVSSLFTKTEGMFKKWIVFMGSRALEIIILFSILYAFLNILDTKFTDMFSMKACTESYKFLSWVYIDIFQTTSDDGFAEWMLNLCEIAALIFIFRLIMDKIPMIATALIDIESAGTIGAGGGKTGDLALATDAQGGMFGTADDVLNRTKARTMQFGKYGLNQAVSATSWVGGKVLGATGLRNAFISAGKILPFRGFGARKMDSMINKYRKEGEKQKMSGAQLEQYVKSNVMNDIAKMRSGDNQSNSLMQDARDKDGKIKSSGNTNLLFSDRNKANLLGLDEKLLDSRLEKMNKDALDKHMSEFVKDLKKEQALNTDPNKILVGDKMHDRLLDEASSWAKGTSLANMNMNEYVRGLENKSAFSSKELAQIINNNKNSEDKILDAIEEAKTRRDLDTKTNIFKSASDIVDRNSPRIIDINLAKKLGRDRAQNKIAAASRYLSSNQFNKDKKTIEDRHKKMMDRYRAGETTLKKSEIDKDKEKDMKVLLEKKKRYEEWVGNKFIAKLPEIKKDLDQGFDVINRGAISPVVSSEPKEAKDAKEDKVALPQDDEIKKIDENLDARKKEADEISKDADKAEKEKDPVKAAEVKNKLLTFSSKKNIEDIEKDLAKLDKKIDAAEKKIAELKNDPNKKDELALEEKNLDLLNAKLGASKAQKAGLEAIESTMSDEQKNN